LGAGADANEVAEARRRLAKSAHPDVGGTLAEMQRVNEAAEQALALLGVDRPSTARATAPSAAGRDRAESPTPRGQARHDHPSFTIEMLPVEAFEGLLVVASWLGDVISDDPPYGLEIALVDPVRGWCRLDLVPDAGASTVSLSVAAEPGSPVPDVEQVRDLWIDGLNQLDWSNPTDN
jgi:hypothetical protein